VVYTSLYNMPGTPPWVYHAESYSTLATGAATPAGTARSPGLKEEDSLGETPLRVVNVLKC